MKVVVGEFARAGLEAQVGSDLPAGINAALVFYVDKLRRGRGPAAYPKFLPGRASPTEDGIAGDDGAVRVEVQVGEPIEKALADEAAREGVSTAAIASHAILIYLAELDLVGDAGSAAGRSERA